MSTLAISMSIENWEKMDVKAASTHRLCFANEDMQNVKGEVRATDLWSWSET